jgi:hypothetical protein
MGVDRVQLMEHLAAKSPLSLHEFCELVQRLFGLPDFVYDFENETEWGAAESDGVGYNVSRPFEPGTLQEWDSSVPAGCNFGLTLEVFRDGPRAAGAGRTSEELVRQIGQSLADGLGSRVYHHRTWVGAGQNVTRGHVFLPGPERA